MVGVLKHSHSKTNLKCPSCRQLIPQEEISYIVDYGPSRHVSASASAGGAPELDRSIAVKGSYGTKIEGMLLRLLLMCICVHVSKILLGFSIWLFLLRMHFKHINMARHIRLHPNDNTLNLAFSYHVFIFYLSSYYNILICLHLTPRCGAVPEAHLCRRRDRQVDCVFGMARRVGHCGTCTARKRNRLCS